MNAAQRIQALSAGDVERHVFASQLLAGNRAGDPHVRELPIYVPHAARERRLPVLFLLVGFTGNGQEYLESHPWRRGVVFEYDEALRAGTLPAAILVMPNAFTKFGGSQYVDSSFLGPYASYVARELTEYVEAHTPALPERRGVLGKSSGGVGALHLAMRHRGAFQAAASISGDAGFEGCHALAFWEFARALVAHDGDVQKFIDEFLAHHDLSGDKFGALNTIAMAACYSPNLASPLGFDLPVDPRTAERIESVWQRWLEFDPLIACERYAKELRALQFLHIECGVRDEYNIQFGTRRLSKKLRELGVAHTHEEHEGSHRNIQQRYLPILQRMIESLQG
jgi:enterochelin esterase family protein